MPSATVVRDSTPLIRMMASVIAALAWVLKQARAVATRYDKLALRYQATIHIAAIDTWLRDL